MLASYLMETASKDGVKRNVEWNPHSLVKVPFDT